jgi:2-dehydropantoate 2-reductase
MRICVVGCGAIGSLFAAHLAALGDAEVWVFDVSQTQVRAINEHGLHCSGVQAGTHGIQARSDGAQIPPCEFGIVATKSLHTDAAWPPPRPPSRMRRCAASRTAWATRRPSPGTCPG